MRSLVSVMALSVALAITVASPSVGEAQSNKSSVRKAATVQKAQRPAKKNVAQRKTTPRNCAGYTWWGCTGWDPDGYIRDLLARDVGDDN